jgi:ComF family protein
MSTTIALLRAVATWLADLLAPPACAACDARLRRRAVLCAACAQAVVPAAPLEAASGVPPVVAFALYGGPIAAALRRLKYGSRPELGGVLSHLARQAVRDAGLEADVVVPVPLHPVRLAERGYNQAALLGAGVAEEVGARMEARGLARTRHTPQQARLARGARLENVTGAFRVRVDVGGKRVVLVDDVCTTGATLAACAEVLREAGAKEVVAVVVARAERGG